MAVARRYGAGETSSRRNFVLAHSLGCSLALRLAAEWGTNGVSVAAVEAIERRVQAIGLARVQALQAAAGAAARESAIDALVYGFAVVDARARCSM